MGSIDWNSVGVIAGILGLVGTIISLCLAIYYANRTKRPNQLKYIPGDFFNIYNTLLSNKFKLDIKYGEAPITQNIFYMSGKLVVKGDIKTKDNEIFIILPEGWKWIGTSKEQSHGEINANFKVDEKSNGNAILTFGKLRREDYINISAIIEGKKLSSEEKSSFQNKIRFSHRIDDTDIIKVEYPETSGFKKDLPIYLTSLGLAFCLLAFLTPRENLIKVIAFLFIPAGILTLVFFYYLHKLSDKLKLWLWRWRRR